MKKEWYIDPDDPDKECVVAGSVGSIGDIFYRIAEGHTPEIAEHICKLHNEWLKKQNIT